MRLLAPFALALLMIAPLAAAAPLASTALLGVDHWAGVATDGSTERPEEFLPWGGTCRRGEFAATMTLRVLAGAETDVVRLTVAEDWVDVKPGEEASLSIRIDRCAEFTVEGVQVATAAPYEVALVWH